MKSEVKEEEYTPTTGSHQATPIYTRRGGGRPRQTIGGTTPGRQMQFHIVIDTKSQKYMSITTEH